MSSISIRIKLNPNLYLKDPQETKLGQRIIQEAIKMIYDLGFEDFTFKKLAVEISSTEASIYRYFANKHMLLIYLMSWYWEWIRFQIRWSTINIPDAKKRLESAVESLVLSSNESTDIEFVNQSILHKIVIAEGSKSYHTIHIDEENKKGLFISYKELVDDLSSMITDVDHGFPYPHTLASNLLEMANNQLFFADHLPGLCDINSSEQKSEELIRILKFFTFKLLDFH